MGGFGAIAFRLMINWVNQVMFVFPNSLLDSGNFIITILAPTLGGLIVGALIYNFAREAKGHGVPEIIQSVNNENARMRIRVPFVKILASAVTIGTGGSAGREGPIAQIGGGFASALAQKFKLSPSDSKILVVSGLAAGIAASFNAPLGGTLFGYEIVRRDKKAFNVLPLLLSSVVGTSVGEYFLGDQPSFSFPEYVFDLHPKNIPSYIILGILLGVYGVIWVKGFYKLEDLLEKIPIHPILLAGFGGLLVGILEVWWPEVSGITYDPIERAFRLEYALHILVILVVAKFLATAFSIGSGGSGGVFAPTLFQGALLGTVMGSFFHFLGIGFAPIAIYSMLGMAALFGASGRAPLTAVIMTSEMVGDFRLIIPLMFAVAVSWITHRSIMDEDIYILKLQRRGINFNPSVDILEDIHVRDVMTRVEDGKIVSVSPHDRIEHVLDLMKKTGHTGYPVINEDNRLVGIITEHDVDKALESKELKEWIVNEVCSHDVVVVGENCPLSILFMKMDEKKINRFPVVDHDDHSKLKGWISRTDIVKTYRLMKSSTRASEFEEELFNEIHTE